jgi:RHS repeat-associated protein
MTGYLYNAEGVRIAKGTIATMSCDPVTSGFQLTESYVLGQGGEELTQLDGNNNWQRTNVYGAGKQLATYDLISDPTNPSPSLVPALHFQLTDPLGTRRMQVSASGQPETDIQSLPYGEQLNSFPDQFAPATADDATPLHFTQHERDTESGNDYFGARYYASLMGRFISPDWSSAPDTVPYANFNDPQSLNLYAYAGNNPLIYGDSNGHVYTLCDQFGQCEKGISDIDFEQREAGARAAGEHWNGGKITLADGSAGGTYVQTDVDLPGDAASNRAAANMIGNGGMGMVNMFMKNMAYTVAGGLAGRAIGWGWEAASDWAVLNSGDTVVYRSVNAAGDVDYVGITNDIVRRGGEHLRDAGREIQAIRGLENLTPADARAVEQALIETHGIGSAGTLTNKINSIASTNPGYARALAQGMRILQSVGYFK